MSHSTAARWASRWDVPTENALLIRDELLIGLRKEWGKELTLKELGAACWSPINLGLLLLRATGTDMTPLPGEEQTLIRKHSPQHRIELRGSNESLPGGVACFDGRCMYLGCCDDIGLGSGEYRYQKGFTGNDRGKARVVFTVPSTWQSVGLLPVKSEDGARWLFPEAGTHETWADLQEVRLAIRAGWQVITKESLVWSKGDPMGLWAKRLAKVYSYGPPLSDCIRTLALRTIGAMHTPWRRESVEVLPDSPLVSLESIQEEGDGSVTVERWAEKGHSEDEYHPEWTTAIWARARLRIARALPQVPVEYVLGVRGDAIYLDARALLTPLGPEWMGRGECGRLRMKWYDPNPRPRVRSWDDLKEPNASQA